MSFLHKKPKFHDGDVSAAIDRKLKEINDLREHIKALACPSCSKTGGFNLGSVEFGPKGWQVGVICTCRATGVLTGEGLHFDLTLPEVKEEKK